VKEGICKGFLYCTLGVVVPAPQNTTTSQRASGCSEVKKAALTVICRHAAERLWKRCTTVSTSRHYADRITAMKIRYDIQNNLLALQCHLWHHEEQHSRRKRLWLVRTHLGMLYAVKTVITSKLFGKNSSILFRRVFTAHLQHSCRQLPDNNRFNVKADSASFDSDVYACSSHNPQLALQPIQFISYIGTDVVSAGLAQHQISSQPLQIAISHLAVKPDTNTLNF